MTSMNTLELLAPAGTPEKLKTALYFGADAVYAGGKDFSLRSYAGNFTDKELAEASEYAKKLGKKLYVTANIFAKNTDFPKVREYFRFLQDIAADAVLVTDPGIIAIAKEAAPLLPLHLSTQANTLNKYSAKFWEGQGISRVVLARELGLQEIKEISDYCSLELEAFVHGAMCVSYSGRCLLSNYLTSRDANRGECVQACRWKYRLSDVSDYPHPDIIAEEDERGTYLLNSRDLNLLEEIPELAKSGVRSLKIEGRMKSEYYVATVVNAYRRAIDEYYAFGKITNASVYNEELVKITHRDYTKAYFLGANEDTIHYKGEQYPGTHEFIAVVQGYSDGKAQIEMRNRFKKGDVLEVLSPSSAFGKAFTVGSIINSDGASIEDAKIVQELLSIDIPFEVREGDIFRKKVKGKR